MKAIATIVNDSASLMQAKLQQERDKRGFAIDSYFYRSHHVYQLELQSLIFKSWIYAAHISEVSNPGDYVLFEIGEDSFIIVRDRQGDVHALMNICRHRGARVCEVQQGNCASFVCPYHCWTYNTDGTLRSARHMEMRDDFDPSLYGLKKARIAIYMGLIFINCDSDAEDPLSSFAKVDAQLGGYELQKAKIAHQQTYQVDANWKLCLENYLECYHCATAHKDYAKIHTFQDLHSNVATQIEEMHKRAAHVTGISDIEKEHRSIYLGADSFGACVSAHRYGLYDGYVTGSEDGKPVAPLMGRFQGYDGGAGDFQFGPLSFMLNYPDHCVLYRFIPRSITQTDMYVAWFVNGNAQEGVDYDVSKLTALWHKTTLEDEFIITRNSKGVTSDFFEPGPYHPEFEKTLQTFIDWYIESLDAAQSA